MNNRPGADRTSQDLEAMLGISAARAGPWAASIARRPRVVTTVATTGEGVDRLWAAVVDHRTFLSERQGPRAR